MTKWENFFDEKIKEIAKGKTVFDIGGGSRFQKELKAYKKYFSGCDYKTIDIDAEANPDIIADAHSIPIADNSADGVICKAVLEHVKNPMQVTEEIYRILKSNGKCFVYVPFLYPYHGHDYWRFTEDGVRYLFRKFNKIEICPVRGFLETMAIFLPYQNKFPINVLVAFAGFLDNSFSKYQSKKQVSGYNIFLIK